MTLYYSPYRIGSNSFSLLLDDALIESKKGKEIIFIKCKGEIKACNTNLLGSKAKCITCNHYSNSILKSYHPQFKILDLKNQTSINRRDIENLAKNIIAQITNLNDLKQIYYKNIPIGLGVVSSYVSHTRNLDPVLNKSNKAILLNIIEGAIFVFESFNNILEEYNPKELVLFNGRFSDLRVVYELGKLKKIKTRCLEYTSTEDKKHIRKVEFNDALPHDIVYNHNEILKAWNSGFTDNEEKIKIATEFYYKKRNGQFSGDTIYTLNQKKDLLPAKWNRSKKNIVIFNSSEDEFFSIGESWEQHNLFRTQIEGIKYLVQSVAQDSEIIFHLRIHPNLTNLKFRYVKELFLLEQDYKNVNVIGPDSNISTYSLIDNADLCIVFGSTVGAEANYWGKPVILLGGSFYRYLDIAYIPKDKNDLKNLLKIKLKNKNIEDSLKYAFYTINPQKGEKFEHVNYNFREIKIFNKSYYFPLSLFKNNSVFYLLLYNIVQYFSLNYFYYILFQKNQLTKDN